MHILGLTGGIACGKSEATRIFTKLHIPVIDCDAVAHNAQNNDPRLQSLIRKDFPEAFENGILNRTILSQIALSNPTQLSKIEAITLPFVRQDIDKQLNDNRKQQVPLLVIDAPLLFEKNLDALCDSSVCLYVDPEIQKERFLRRPNTTEAKLALFLSKQLPMEEKRARATYEIHSDTIENLRQEILGLTMALSAKLPKAKYNPYVEYLASRQSKR